MEITSTLYLLANVQNSCVRKNGPRNWAKLEVSDGEQTAIKKAEQQQSILSERSCCLAKTPFLPEQELWDLFINSDNDDRMGALVLMYQKHFSFLLQNYIILSKTDDV